MIILKFWWLILSLRNWRGDEKKREGRKRKKRKKGEKEEKD